jgi:hypothetical protein
LVAAPAQLVATVTRRNDPIDDLVTAIRHEITAVLAGNGSDGEKIALRDGRLLGTHNAGHDYVFSARNWRDLGNDRLLIRPSTSRREWVRATASVIPDGKVRVTATTDLGRNLANVQLRADDTVSLELLADRIAAAGDRTDTLNTTAASWILGDGAPRIGRCTETARFVRGYESLRLNTRQRLAIEHALASDITFIWGPPGTGKTDVVSRIIEGCYRQGLRVLFVAPTHVAVDQALERACELLEHEDQFTSGLVQRAGEIAVPSLARRYGSAIKAEDIADRLSAELTKKAEEITPRLAAVRADIQLHEQIVASTRERSDLREREEWLTRVISAHARDAARAEQAVHDADAKLNRLGTASGIFRARKQEKIQLLLLEAERHETAAANFRAQRHTAEDELQTCRTALDAVTSRLSDDLARGSNLLSMARLQAAERELNDELALVEQELNGIVAAVRDRCRVMGTTVAKAVQSSTLTTAIDVVIIDEAGMVNLPSAWYAAGLAAQRVVLAGDFRQLPPVTHGATSRTASDADRAHSRHWMDRDVFTAAGLVDAAGRAQPDARMICLDTQYRMRPDICAVVNTVAYPDSPLRTMRDDTSRVPESPLLPGALVLVDTTTRRVPHTGRGYGAHKTNPVHEAVIHELIRGLQYDTVLPTRKADGAPATDQLAVITPYRDQKQALQASLRHRFGEPFDGLVDTVHRFQGSQRPVVVIDTVAGAGDKLGQFYAETGLSSTTSRLLNVALSRAQDHLVVVADVEFLRQGLSPGSEATRMLDHLVRHAHRLSVDDLVPIRAAADLSGLSEEELARPAFFPADEVPRAVEWDIKHSARSLEIYCPFLDRRPVRTWLRRLEPRMADGIRVTVHTRPPENGAVEAELVAELRRAGCEVSLRERMHEKVMIVDETVLWHGSLNLFANTGPTDLMMRITDPSACAQVRRIMTTARRERPLAQPQYRTGAGRRTRSIGDVAPGDVFDGRLYLDVPFEEKDDAKHTVSARWDRERRLWHVAAGTPRHQVARWLPPTSERSHARE